MRELMNKLMLFCCCLLLLPLSNLSLYPVAALLTAVSLSALSGYFEERFSFWAGLAYFGGCLFQPDLLLFLPLVAYDMISYHRKWQGLFCLVPLLTAFVQLGLREFLLAAVFTTLAALLKFRTGIGTEYQNRYRELQDSAKELSIDLQSRNRKLLERQDYEIQLARLGERNRIAREIHDNVGHMLTRSILQVGAMRVTCADPAVKEQLTTLGTTLDEAMNSIRTSVHDLHDESIDLQILLNKMTAEFTFCPIRLVYDASGMDKSLEYCFAAIAKEALSNIARHSNATSATITVREHPALYQLIIQDNGTKFERAGGHGIGLKNMEERVAAFRGTFHAEHQNGFRLFISISKEELQ